MGPFPTPAAWQAALEARHGQALQAKFSAATVAICGLGGLGSHLALSLARAGVGKLILLDFDRVDLTNLHRQQYKASQIGQPKALALADNLREANPYLALEPHVVRLTEDNLAPLLAEATLVCEAFDQAEAKAMLVNAVLPDRRDTNAVLERFPEKFLVAASGMAGLGSANAITTRRVSRRFYLCGDGVSDVADGLGLVASRVAVCAGHQAHMVLRLLAEEYEP